MPHDSPDPQRRGRRAPTGDRRPRRRGIRGPWVFAAVAVAVAAVLASALVRSTVAEPYRIPSGSMEPLLLPGDRISVDRSAYDAAPVRRGDVVVVDGEGSFVPYDSRPAAAKSVDVALQWLGLAPDTTAVVKRVAGTGGDTVSCCTGDGLLQVNGEPVQEDYLAEPPASTVPFTATVPEGRLFLLGDNRHQSLDSRALLGAPGGGMIAESSVVGRVTAIAWPPARRTDLEQVDALSGR